MIYNSFEETGSDMQTGTRTDTNRTKVEPEGTNKESAEPEEEPTDEVETSPEGTTKGSNASEQVSEALSTASDEATSVAAPAHPKRV